jgi:hypothetical protein
MCLYVSFRPIKATPQLDRFGKPPVGKIEVNGRARTAAKF